MMPMRAFCIVLPETPERTEKAKAHFAERSVYDVKMFPGIHAERFGLKTVFPYEVDAPGSGFNMGPKPTGIWLSHYMLWGALTMLHDDCFMVLESDAKFPKDWHTRLLAALQHLPKDFDVLYIGSCCCANRPQKHIGGEVYEVKYPMCTHAIIWAKKALPIVLETQRKCYAPIDISLAFHTLPLLKCYAVLPRIIEQFDTDIAP